MKQIEEKLAAFEGKKILVFGDVGLDEYIQGEVKRISPEAPVPILEVFQEDFRLGLAGNVAQNISSLKGIPYLVSVVGRDRDQQTFRKICESKNVATDYLVEDSDRPTIKKSRVMAQHHHLVRIDYETQVTLSESSQKKLLGHLATLVPQVDAVIVEDYAKGVVTEQILPELMRICSQYKKSVFVDPSRKQKALFYKGCFLFKPNFDESLVLAGVLAGQANHSEKSREQILREVSENLIQQTESQFLVITQGKEGMTVFSGGKSFKIPTSAREVYDVTGAGDTVIAALTLGMASGLTIQEACQIANYAAGYVVGQVGCVDCPQDKLLQYIESL